LLLLLISCGVLRGDQNEEPFNCGRACLFDIDADPTVSLLWGGGEGGGWHLASG
jgi:hypothetical protein